MLGGILLGLFDGLRAIDAPDGPAAPLSSLALALFLSSGIWGVIGALGLPALVRLTEGVAAAAPDRSDRLPPTIRLLNFIVVYVWLILAALGLSEWIQGQLAIPSHVARVGLAFVGTCLIAVALTKGIAYFGPRSAGRVALLTAAAVTALAAWFLTSSRDLAARIDFRQVGEQAAAPKHHRGPNVLLVVLDTTRARNLSAYGYGRDTTPFLSEFARESTLYLDAISPAPWTVPAHASLFTGLSPSIHQATTEHRWLSSRFSTVAEILRDNGYLTAGFSCNSWVGPSFNLNQGFQHFFQVYRLPSVAEEDPLRRLFWGRVASHLLGTRLVGLSPPDKGAAMTNRFVRRWLDQWQKSSSDRPFFVFINYIEPHLPYNPPPDVRSRFVNAPLRPALRGLVGDDWIEGLFRAIGLHNLEKADYEQLASLYDAELAYLDQELRELLDDLRHRRLLDDTLVLIVGDHGENLGEHGGLLDHCFSVHQTLLHVPLIVRYPPLFPEGERYPGLVSTASVFSTIVEAAGARLPPGSPPCAGPLPRGGEVGAPYAMSEYGLPIFELSSLATDARGADVRPFAVRQRAIQDGRFKLVVRSDGESSLYDLASDPGEENPVDPASTPEGERLRRQLDAWVAALRPETLPPPASEAALDSQTRESLRSLGYIH
jgi:arylsulfatase A-like enzyme